MNLDNLLRRVANQNDLVIVDSDDLSVRLEVNEDDGYLVLQQLDRVSHDVLVISKEQAHQLAVFLIKWVGVN